MGAKGEALAKEFEAKAEDAKGVLEKLTDADWKKTTMAEKWTVGVTAHHLAGSYERVPQTLHKKGAATAAAVVRNLSDEQLAKSGTVFAGLPPMSAEQLVMRALINHTDEHYGSIRKTIGA